MNIVKTHIQLSAAKQVFFLLLLFTGIMNAQIVNIPDANFKAKLLAASPANQIAYNGTSYIKIDANSDGEIQQSEALAVLNLDVSSSSINDLTGIEVFISIKNLSCQDNGLTSLSLNLSALIMINCSQNSISSLSVNGCPNLFLLDCSDNPISSLDLQNLSQLVNLSCISNSNLLSVNASGCSNLSHMGLGNSPIISLDLSNCTSLTTFELVSQPLTSLNLTGCSNLHDLLVWNTQLSSMTIDGLNNLTQLEFRSNSQLNTLNVVNCQNLTTLNCADNHLTGLNISNSDNITNLNCQNNFLTSLDVSNLSFLTQLDCPNNQLSTFDLSNQHNLAHAVLVNNPLINLFAKNGNSSENLIINNTLLQFVCADELQVEPLETQLNNAGIAAVVTTYCSFTPGGDYNTITGKLLFDSDNNGCDASDVANPYLKVKIDDGIDTSETFTSVNGIYNFYTQAGSYAIIPQLEQPSYFSVVPSPAVINFPQLDNTTQTQNFCVTADGVHPDLEIILVQISSAVPGFDTSYKLVYRNKGNQTASGSINVTFDDAKTDFVSSSQIIDNQALNSLLWNYSNLQPFETRSIGFILNLNSPLENPTVNSGDILDFTATINFAQGDETPADNVFELHQTIVNALDPNDKVCLEGTAVTPDNIGKYLHYNINFENLGTVAATNIVIKDFIDSTKFDVDTMQLLDVSHSVNTQIRNNKVEFIFENINLPIGGHGNVLFKIKTKDNLVIGDEVANTANIFFDYNTPIETNEARTAFALLHKPGFTKDSSITIAPNPAKNMIAIHAKSNITSIQLFDIGGRTLQILLANKNDATLDVSNKQNGIYFLKVTTEDGTSIEKIVKE
jgi:uncharacterized repeat protein (TIGR01451 family)